MHPKIKVRLERSLVSKPRRFLSTLGMTDGQAAIFILMMFSLIFMFFGMAINLGMLVHHKINLQNAADMAALAAASEQARILNMLGWKNYELRKNFKEFVYTYWVEFNDRHYDFPDPRLPNFPGFAIRKARALQHLGKWTKNPTRGRIIVPSYCMGDQFGSTPQEAASRKYCENEGHVPAQLPPLYSGVIPGLGAVGSETIILAQALEDMRRRGQIHVEEAWRQFTQYNEMVSRKEPDTYRLRAKKIFTTYLQELSGIMNGNFHNNIPPAWINFANNEINTSDPEYSLRHYASPLTELPQNFHLLARLTAEKNYMNNNRQTLNVIPLEPASREYVRIKPITIDFHVFYTKFDDITGEISFQPRRVDEFIVGVEKDPTVKTFYALMLQSKPDLPFLPGLQGDNRWTLTALSAAAPFGGRIGPQEDMDDYRLPVAVSGGTYYLPHIFVDEGQSIDDTQILHDLKKEGDRYEPSRNPFRHEPILSPNKWDVRRYIFPHPTTSKQTPHWTDLPMGSPGPYSLQYGASDLYTSWGGPSGERAGYSVKLVPLRSQDIFNLLDGQIQGTLTDIQH